MLSVRVQVVDKMHREGMLWVLLQEDAEQVRQHRFRRSCFPQLAGLGDVMDMASILD